jgi:membrane protein implicated in regulation of membrane protease activity
MAWWIWIVLGAILLGAEVVIAADFWLVFFGASAFILGLVGAFGITLPLPVQWLLFAAVAVLGVWLFGGRRV